MDYHERQFVSDKFKIHTCQFIVWLYMAVNLLTLPTCAPAPRA
jgi:hypothetical protein